MKKRLNLAVACGVLFGVVSSVVLPPCGGIARGDEAVPQTSWPDAVRALRADILSAPPADVELGPWHYRGPEPAPRWNERWEELTVPTVDLADRTDAGEPRWAARGNWADGRVHDLPPGDWHVHYLVRTLSATQDTELALGLGSDDGFKLWLNGQLVAQRNIMRGAAPDQEQVTLQLPAGEHHLLFAVYNAGGGTGFYFNRSDFLPVVRTLQQQFPRETAWFIEDIGMPPATWLARDDASLERSLLSGFQGRLLPLNDGLKQEIGAYLDGNPAANDAGWMPLYLRAREASERDRFFLQQLASVDLAAARRAVKDLIETFGDRYPGGPDYLERIDGFIDRFPDPRELLHRVPADPQSARDGYAMMQVVREALLANPLLDIEEILMVKRRFGNARGVMGTAAGHPDSFATEVNVPATGWDNEIIALSNFRGDPEFRTVYKPDRNIILRNLDLHFNGGKVMFSSIDLHNRWALFEVNVDGTGLRQLTPTEFPDVAFFDSCYLPDGRIITASTASYGSLDCVGGGAAMSDLYLLDPETGALRQLTFDQVHPQHPTVRNDGSVMYMRWEYSDLQHYFSRFLFSMNPDGTSQRAYYGSGSMFPTAIRHARAIPGHPTKTVAILGGHHGIAESGRLTIIDPSLARAYPFRYTPESLDWADHRPATLDIHPEVLPAEKTGFVQEIPGYGKDVVGNVRDTQVDGVWPHFTHPHPLSENYFLVSMKRDPGSLWGIYLVDVFDNMTLLKEFEGAALFDPIPLASRPMPPVIPDRVRPGRNTATMLIQDVYMGEGLPGVPRGTVDRLRIFAYHFSYMSTGNHHAVSRGVQGPWDVRRILGTVPIESDGSAYFEVPADTPISIQPIDKEGRALQLMRTWTVGMPGETVSCIGCHEGMNQSPPATPGKAFLKAPVQIEPWYGPARPYAYEFEVQPVLERYCVGCHGNDDPAAGLSFARNALSYDGPAGIPARRQVSNTSRTVERSFDNLHPFARRPGPESQLMVHVPLEFHASTSPLIQMLEKGHHGVALDREARERLYTWIDLNVPFYGRWNPPGARGFNQAERRAELARRFSSLDIDPEADYVALEQAHAAADPVTFVHPEVPAVPDDDGLDPAALSFPAAQARSMQEQDGGTVEKVIALSDGVSITLRRVPAGSFVMGSLDGYPDERPRAAVEIAEPFWMGVTEITNAQYALFDPSHDTGYHVAMGKDKAIPGKIGNHRDQPVSRVSWQDAMAFCAWLSEKTGLDISLPTEAQWEWAARAGTATRFHWGEPGDDFSRYANLADRRRLHTRTGWDGGSVLQRLHPWDPNHHYPLRDDRFDDGALVTNYVGQYEANAWGLHDMAGNVSEWTRSSYLPYPYRHDDGRNGLDAGQRKVARGGSWYERPRDAGASIRFAYAPYQKVFNVGFRVAVSAVPAAGQAVAASNRGGPAD